ncbi:DUF2956 domain-containing protein [Reinekea sp.]|jgi:hypothetical protein|uniref:DUF2956 domain-containing protein n=1 Tax=Reinekea sp. TaxID=1970455 RepID=UPI003988EBE3
MKNSPSEKTQQEAMQIAKATARPGQTKEHTKLIAKGVEKGIAEYKKQQKAKARERDKAKKKVATGEPEVEVLAVKPKASLPVWLPWVLLVVSWVGFIAFTLITTNV